MNSDGILTLPVAPLLENNVVPIESLTPHDRRELQESLMKLYFGSTDDNTVSLCVTHIRLAGLKLKYPIDTHEGVTRFMDACKTLQTYHLQTEWAQKIEKAFEAAFPWINC